MRTLMKSMMAGALVSLTAVVASGSAEAVTCQTAFGVSGGNLGSASAGAAGFSCTIGDKTFSNFQYGQDGTNVPAANVGVNVDTSLTPFGLVFNAFWQNTTSSAQDALITFTVTAPAAIISDFELALDGVVGNILDGATITPLIPSGPALPTFTASDNATHMFNLTGGPFQSIMVQDDLGIGANSSVSSLHKAFSQVPGPVVGAGMPGLIAACGGLLALARRRRQKVA
jgi:hypothetical protein